MRADPACRDPVEAYAWLQLAMQAGTPAEMQIAVLAKMQHLEARLAPDLRDEARLRTAHLVSLVKAHYAWRRSQDAGG